MRKFISSQVDPFAKLRGVQSPPSSDWIDTRVLASGTAKRHTIPSGSKYVVFSSDNDVWVKFGDSDVTATVPSTDITDGSSSELNPTAREILSSMTHISMISSETCKVTLMFYEGS